MRSSRIVQVLATAAMLSGTLGSVVGSTVQADELKMTTAPQPSANWPARGMSMEKVEAVYGAPANRRPAIGEPPITRWEYPGFVVYFEHQYVIHSVGMSDGVTK